MKEWLSGFLAAWQFLLRIPLPYPQRWAAGAEARSVPFFPLIGLVLGLLLWASGWALSSLFSPGVAAMLVLLLWLWLTGALHMDGWMDLADALGSWRSREEMLRILKDSRVGSKGVLAAVSLLALKWAALTELLAAGSLKPLLWAPVAGRAAMCVALLLWPGIGKGLFTAFQTDRRLATWASICLAMVLSAAWGGWHFLLSLLLSVAAGSWMADRVSRKLGGLNGDAVGAVNEAVEVVFLFAMAIAVLL